MVRILKIPFDKCIVDKQRTGAAEAPDVIQKLAGRLKGVEWSDVEVTADFEATQNNITKAALEGYRDDVVVGIGGDHSVSYGMMRAFAEKFECGALVFIDAHPDCQDDFLPPTHEDVLRAAVKEKFFKPENILIIGARMWTKQEEEFVKENKIRVGKLEDVQEFAKGQKNIYVSVDIDVVDPVLAPGTGWPEPAGLTDQQILGVIRSLKNSGKVKVLDVVEVSPKFDINNMTSKLAAKILAEISQSVGTSI